MSTRRKLPRLALAIAGVTAVLALVASGCSADDSSSDGSYRFTSATAIGRVIPKQDRKPAPELEAQQLTGDGKLSAAQYKGRVVVMAFWASWCGPCRVEMPQLQGLHQELANKGVAFLGVDSRDDESNAKAFLATNKITFPSVVDVNGELPQKLGNIPGSLPFTVLIDKFGKVAGVYVVRYGAADLDKALTTLRAET